MDIGKLVDTIMRLTMQPLTSIAKAINFIFTGMENKIQYLWNLFLPTDGVKCLKSLAGKFRENQQ